jgi:23S rRNA pseudouridine1911/1915/1917 synthase
MSTADYNVRHLTIPTQLAGLRLDQALARLLPEESRTRLARLIEQGHVTVDGRPAAAKLKLRSGESVDVALAPRVEACAFAPEAIALAVVHEDDDVLVVDKPAGLVVHPGSGNWSGTMLNALLHHAPSASALARAGIVHRLDKDTSGLLVVAKTVEAQADLVKQLAERTMRRVYVGLVQGDPPASGTIDAPLGRDAKVRTRMAVTHRGKPARTIYRVLERFGRAALVECRLDTGRTHQIRVHFQHIRHPLVGDTVYRRGTRHGIAFPRQALHAAELSLKHPSSGETVTWRAPLPREFKKLVDQLRACEI